MNVISLLYSIYYFLFMDKGAKKKKTHMTFVNKGGKVVEKEDK